MSKLIFYVAAKENTDTYETCIKLQPATNYTDTIIRDNVYVGQTPNYITIVNECSTSFVLPAQLIFQETSNGGNFEARIMSNVVIGENATVNVPIAYFGSYKKVGSPSTYTISLNGSTATYTLNIVNGDTPPVTQDNVIYLENRVNTTITKDSLIYSDVDGDTITNVRFFGDVTKLYLNASHTTLYTANTELPIDFTLYFKAPNTDSLSTFMTDYNVKANGVWSS